MRMPVFKKSYVSISLVILSMCSLGLLLIGEANTMGALWVAICCLLPAMIIAATTRYLSVQIYCATVLVTQTITVPIFYLRADSYAFDAYRPFEFTALSSLPTLSLLGSYLFLVAILASISDHIFKSSKITVAERAVSFESRYPSANSINPQHKKSILFIYLIMIVSLPLKFFMFDMGIGIVGTPPPNLPFRLSGILFYLGNYIIPLAIGYLYIKTNRTSITHAIVVLVYASLIGLSSSSKGVLLLTASPIIGLALADRRWAILATSGIISGFGVTIIIISREIVHISDGLITWSFTELGVLGTLLWTVARLELSWENLLVFSDIAARVEGFQGLLLASQFNPNSVGGELNLFLKSLSNTFVDLGHDAIHTEFLGYTVPVGFYNVAASINAWMLMASNRNIFMIFPFAIYTVLILFCLEKMTFKLSKKYNFPRNLRAAILFCSTLWFSINPGTLEFIAIFLTIMLLALIPKISINSRCDDKFVD